MSGDKLKPQQANVNNIVTAEERIPTFKNQLPLNTGMAKTI
jgi:hypothetical protein